MSYSLIVSGRSKDEAKITFSQKFDETIVRHQESHNKDRDTVVAVVSAFVELLNPPNENQVVQISASGSLSWRHGEDGKIRAAAIAISASLKDRES